MWYRILPLSYPLQRPWPSPWWNDKTRIGLIDQISTAGEMLPAGAGLGWAGADTQNYSESLSIIGGGGGHQHHHQYPGLCCVCIHAPVWDMSLVRLWVRGLKIHSVYTVYPHHSIHFIFERTIPKTLLWMVNVNGIWHLISSAFCYWKLYQLMRKEDIWEHNSYLILIGKHPAHAIY